ncbi:Uncharacterised protein [Candidatus Tiddalikarchaeum anstoanum]|nr:Uncharacterised protein [Candidatus Tiddalikarchaeum anstoanum]
MMRTPQQPQIKEEYGIVLDFLQHGYPFDEKRVPIAQVLGKTHLVLLEVIPKREVTLQPGEEVYVGDEKRDKIHHVAGRINYDKLTPTAKMEFESAISKIVDENPKRWVEFFNKAGPISKRMHQLELLPGIGNKHMWAIVEEREKKPFESLQDMVTRVPLMPNPKELIIKRIQLELEEADKYRLFIG